MDDFGEQESIDEGWWNGLSNMTPSQTDGVARSILGHLRYYPSVLSEKETIILGQSQLFQHARS